MLCVMGTKSKNAGKYKCSPRFFLAQNIFALFSGRIQMFPKTFPSIICEAKINCGPPKTPIQAVRTMPLICSLIGFTKTCPNDQVKAPLKTKITPKYFPSKSGDPDKTIRPKNAIIIPKIFLNFGLSFNKKYAIKTPKGTSH